MTLPSDTPTPPNDRLQISVEWDEPGAGSIWIDGRRVINFGVETDWSDAWNPKVDPEGLALLDRLPRLVQEVDNAFDVARRYEAMLKGGDRVSDTPNSEGARR